MSRYRNEKIITGIVIHCADTPNGRETTAVDIDQWHGERKPPFTRPKDARIGTGPWAGRNQHAIDLKHIGYHFFIRINGVVEVGRRLSETGAHARGYNQKLIGICLAGTDKFTVEQWESLKALVKGMEHKFYTGYKTKLEIHGHNKKDLGVTPFGALSTTYNYLMDTFSRKKAILAISYILSQAVLVYGKAWTGLNSYTNLIVCIDNGHLGNISEREKATKN